MVADHRICMIAYNLRRLWRSPGIASEMGHLANRQVTDCIRALLVEQII